MTVRGKCTYASRYDVGDGTRRDARHLLFNVMVEQTATPEKV